MEGTTWIQAVLPAALRRLTLEGPELERRLAAYRARQERAVDARRERRAQERSARLLAAIAFPGADEGGSPAAREAIAARVAQLRAAREARRSRPSARRKCNWTEEEEAFLTAWWGLRPDAWVARELGRTVDGCELRAWRLGIRRRDNHFGFEEALAVFGVTRNTLRKWIGRGWVTARKTTIRSFSRTRWSIHEASLRRLVTERSWLVDPAKMRPGHYLTELAREAHAREGWLTTAEAAARVFVSQNVLTRWLTRGYGPFVERPHHGGRGNVVRLVRARDLPALLARAEAAASEHYHEGARWRERRKAERRAA